MANKRFFPNINVPVTAMNSPAMARNSQVMPRTLKLRNHHALQENCLLPAAVPADNCLSEIVFYRRNRFRRKCAGKLILPAHFHHYRRIMAAGNTGYSCSDGQLQTAPNSLKKFSPVNKVFEDKETGVICYRDERGELICEGFDEGPRLSWQQDDVKLEDLVEKGLDYKSMNLSTEALIVMKELKRLNNIGSIISS